jgi:hypothetical protein
VNCRSRWLARPRTAKGLAADRHRLITIPATLGELTQISHRFALSSGMRKCKSGGQLRGPATDDGFPMPHTSIDGKAIAQRVTDQVRADVAAYVATRNRRRRVSAVVLVGDSAASQVYVRKQARTTETVGMRFPRVRPAGDDRRGGLLALVDRLNADPAVNGIPRAAAAA